VVKETDKTVVIEYPGPHAGVHYLLIPKKDMKNIADASDADREYLLDTLKVAGEIIREKNLVDYAITTNGPGYQGVTYLHFHLTAH
jgi:diadenosine tetraphosphate (Ap4A) HIT family hydrolase